MVVMVCYLIIRGALYIPIGPSACWERGRVYFSFSHRAQHSDMNEDSELSAD